MSHLAKPVVNNPQGKRAKRVPDINPEVAIQLMIVFFNAMQEQETMQRQMEGITQKIEKVRQMTQAMERGVEALRAAMTIPGAMRQVLQNKNK